MALVSEQEAKRSFGGGRATLEALVRRLALPRETPLRILPTVTANQGHPLGSELIQWLEVFEQYELEVIDPAGAELRAPGPAAGLAALLEPSGPSFLADVIGFFTAATVIVQQDEMSFLASLAGTVSGASKVYYFHPSDWGLWPTDASISSRLFRTLQEEDREELEHLRFSGEEEARLVQALKLYEALTRPEPLPSSLDPVALFPRVDWLVRVLSGMGKELDKELLRAAPLELYAEERTLLSSHPHLAAYWLWSHFFFDNRDELAACLEATAGVLHPVVAESRSSIVALLAGQRIKLGERDASAVQESKLALLERAPTVLLSAPSRHRRHRARAEAQAATQPEIDALTELEQRRVEEPLVHEALLLFEHLARGGAVPPERTPIHGGMDVLAACERLAEIVDARFLPAILARLERSAQVGDTHRDASWGLILSLAALAEDFDQLHAAVERFGTANFGPRRLQELYRAYGRFHDPRATKILAEGARRWLREVDDWIRMAPAEPVLQLFRRDTLETHELLAELLERASFSVANFDVAVTAAEVAGELKSRRAHKGLTRAIQRKLGRLEDGGRAKVVRAYAVVAGAEAVPILREAFDRAERRWEEEGEDEAVEHQHELAALLSGLLFLTPEDERVGAVARTLLGLFRIRLSPQRTPRRDVIEAALAIVLGAQLGDVRALRSALAPFVQLELRTTPATRPAAEALAKAATEAERELGG